MTPDTPGGPEAGPVLSVRDLRTLFTTTDGPVRAVDGVSFDVARGEVVGIVGESGSGKTTLALSIVGLVDSPGQVSGSVRVGDLELLGASDAELDGIRGNRIGMVFQQAHACLDPVMSIGRQLAQALPHDSARSARRHRVIELLGLVGIADPAGIARGHAYQLSGGMAQRVMIALALAGEPDLVIADEPTSALDVTVQAQIIELLEELSSSRGLAVALISHDLDLVASMADRLLVMYAGQVVEDGATDDVVDRAEHPYTRALLRSNPSSALRDGRLVAIPGEVPSETASSQGCPFAPRCEVRPSADSAPCLSLQPERTQVGPRHGVRCWLHG